MLEQDTLADVSTSCWIRSRLGLGQGLVSRVDVSLLLERILR